MAARNLTMADFTREHFVLFQRCLHTLRQPTISLDDLAQCDQALIQQGFPVLLEFEDTIIADYVEES